MRINLITCFILFAAIFLVTEANVDSCKYTKRYEVHVVNRLPSPDLQLHCASGDDDLGFHNTTTNYDYNFSFCDNILGRTLFFCHLWWLGRDAAFDVFTSASSDRCEHDKCIWEARINGIYLYDDEVYGWNITNQQV